MAFGLPSVSDLIGNPGVVQAGEIQRQGIAGEEAYRKRLGFNALRNIYGDIAGDPQGASTLSAMQRAQELHPGALQQQQATIDSTRANTGLTQARIPGVAAESTRSTVLADDEVENAQLTAARLGLNRLKMGVAAGQDPSQLLAGLGEGGARALGVTPQQLVELGEAIKYDPELIDRMDAAILERMVMKRQGQMMFNPKAQAGVDRSQHVHSVINNAAGGTTTTFKDGSWVATNSAGQEIARSAAGGGTGVPQPGQPPQAGAVPAGQPVPAPAAAGAPVNVGHIKTPEYRGATAGAEAAGKARVTKLEAGEVRKFNPERQREEVMVDEGTTLATKVREKHAAFDQKLFTTTAMASLTDKILDQAIKAVGPTTSGVGSVMKHLYGSNAHDQAKALDHIKGVIFREFVNDMKASSPQGQTGIGRILDAEIPLILAAWGAIEQSQSPERLRQNLITLRSHFRSAHKQLLDATILERMHRQKPGEFAPAARPLPAIPQQAYEAVLADPSKVKPFLDITLGRVQ